MNRREFVAMAPAFPVAAVTATLTLREGDRAPIDLDVSVLKLGSGLVSGHSQGKALPSGTDSDAANRQPTGIPRYAPPHFGRRLRPSDWGFGMTVCIAAVNMAGDIVTASDQMLSMADGTFTAEQVALKDVYLFQGWRALFAASDVGIVPSLIRRIRSRVRWDDRPEVEQLRTILTESFQAERRDRATELYLGPYGIGLPEFWANGVTLFGESGAAVIRERIESHRLECELLVTGHEGEPEPIRTPYLLHVSDPGVVKDYEVPGFWAIGTGAYLALSSLAIRGQSDRLHTHRTIYHVCEAKFAAEAAVGVGHETYVSIHRADGSWASLKKDDLVAMRREWMRVGKPRDPTRAQSRVGQWWASAEWHNKPEPATQTQSSRSTSSSNDQT